MMFKKKSFYVPYFCKIDYVHIHFNPFTMSYRLLFIHGVNAIVILYHCHHLPIHMTAIICFRSGDLWLEKCDR